MVESKRLRDWIYEFDVTSLAALSHTHSPGFQSGACPACGYEGLGLTLLSLQDLDPGLIEDPWSELPFMGEEDSDVFLEDLNTFMGDPSAEALELKAQGAVWQSRLLETLCLPVLQRRCLPACPDRLPAHPGSACADASTQPRG